MIIDGRAIAEKLVLDLKKDIQQAKCKITLSIVLVGSDPSSEIYVSNKIKRATSVGIETRLIHFNEEVSERLLLDAIENENVDDEVHGIIVQMPLPKHINQLTVIEKISFKKDVDGFNPYSKGYLTIGSNKGFVPCTPRGCLHLIQEVEPDISGMEAVVIGRSNIVGKPMSYILTNKNVTVTVTHSKTRNLSDITKRADIIVSAVGNPMFLDRSYFNKNAIVIDVGIKRLHNGKLAGDVHFLDVKDHVRAITPVPGGVGPMTIAYLLKNTFESYKNSIA